MLLASVPEIQRTNLANVVLLLKSLNVSVLSECLLYGWSEPYMTIYLVVSVPAKNTVHTLYIYMVLANPSHLHLLSETSLVLCGAAAQISEHGCCLWVLFPCARGETHFSHG
jgi:hypothetical protein